ncbi:uncharacterized protein LOC100178376 isoform X4 [Ciona intestinalis]
MAAKPMPRIRAGVSGCPVTAISVNEKSNPEKSSKLLNARRSRLSESSCSQEYDNDMFDSVYRTNNDKKLQKELVVKQNDHLPKPEIPDGKLWSRDFHSDHGQVKVNAADVSDTNHADYALSKEATTLLQTSKIEPSIASVAEIERLKQLMMLQVSLISRQQDLLKLRDKEIMHLKANNQSFKCRIERMERRISLSKRTRKESESCSTPHQQNNGVKRRRSESHSKPEMKPEDNITTSTTTQPDAHNIVLTTSPTTTTTTNTNPTNISSTPTKIFPKNENPNNSFKSLSVPTSHSCSNLPSTSISPIKTSPTSDLSCFPVPLSFIERFQSQLFTHTSPKSGEKLDDSKVAIQICEKCPHCVAMANEIKYLLSVAANAGFGTSFTNKSSSNDHMLKVIGICGQDNITEESSHTLNSQPVLLTKQYYYKRLSTEQSTCTLKMEQDNFRDDGTMLNIPTWRVKVISLEDTSTESPIEAIDDESYLKRHSKFEIAEKRRKRWDIQRIREYRYNEKLRQKILKQDLNKDGSVETFSPSLFEIDALAVDNCLPVNVFGHCLPHLPVQEFSLSSSR